MRRYNPKDRTDKLIENKLIYATDPGGPWSDPVVLNGSGIDPACSATTTAVHTL